MKCEKCEHKASDHYYGGCLEYDCKCKKFEPDLNAWQALEKVLDKLDL